MRRAAPRMLARAAGLASTSGRGGSGSAGGAATTARAPNAAWLWTFPPGRGFAALPAAGSGASPTAAMPGGAGRETAADGPTSTSPISGHAREVTASDIGIPAAVQTARDVLHHASLVHFRETLEFESETRLSMPYREALALAKACGVAATDEGASAALEAAHNAGLLLRFQGTVFLRPSEVADLVLRALPDTDLEVRSRLATLEAALAPLDAQRKAIDAAAATRSRTVLWAGLAAFSGQIGVYAYLTWGHPHWGWDATEPWTYLTGQLLTAGAYGWFMYSRRPLDPGEVEKHVAAGAVRAGVAAHGFDAAAHARLASDVARYRRYLDRQQSH